MRCEDCDRTMPPRAKRRRCRRCGKLICRWCYYDAHKWAKDGDERCEKKERCAECGLTGAAEVRSLHQALRAKSETAATLRRELEGEITRLRETLRLLKDGALLGRGGRYRHDPLPCLMEREPWLFEDSSP